MKTILTICASVLLQFLLANKTQAADCLPLKIRNPEGNYIIPGAMGDIVYRRVDGRELSLDAYVQRRGDRRPAVIVVHGGGWSSGSRIAFIGQFLETLTRAGYNWFSIDYRLGGIMNYRDAVDDLHGAVDFIRCHAREFRIDPERIAMLGEDAGSHLAAMLAKEKPLGVKAQALIGGFYDLSEIANLKTSESIEFLTRTSPTNYLVKGMPATLVIHGTNDREAPPHQAVKFCEKIKEIGSRCDYFPVDGAIHRPENWLPSQWGYKEFLVKWLGRELDLNRADHLPYRSNLRKEIVYDSRHELKLDAYIPPGRGPFPAVIIAHGGGWEAGDRVTYVTPLFEPLAKAGFAWFSIDYRLTPQYRNQDQLDDLGDAITYIKRNARTFRIEPGCVAIIGESASGQMVTQFATQENRSDVAAVVSFYGVYNFSDFANDVSPRSIPARLFGIKQIDDEARATLRRYSPIHQIRKDMPPILLIHGTNERLYAQGEAMSKELARNNISRDFYEIEKAPHGMENWEGHPEWMAYKTKLVEWLKAKLKKKS